MIHIRIFRDGSARCRRIEVSGHARAGAEGTDIVCAAVSAVVQVVMLGLGECVQADPAFGHSRGKVFFEVTEAQLEREGVRALMESAALGLRRMAERYDDFMRIEEKSTRSRNGGGDEGASRRPGERGTNAASSRRRDRKTSNVQEASHD